MDLQEEVTGTQEVAAEPVIEVPTDQPESTDEGPTVDITDQDTVPDYTPNLSFKVLDAEKQIDPWLAETIKDKTSEDRARDLMERAYGLDSVKEDRQRLRDENTSLQEISTQYDTVRTDLQNVGQYIQNKDFGRVFDSLQMNKEDVYKWVLEQAELSEMSKSDPQGYDRYMRQSNIQDQNYQLRQQNDMLVQQQQSNQHQTIQSQMQSEFNRPEVSTVQQEFDTRMGRAGAFREEVINRGQAYYARTGTDKMPAEIINEVVGMLGYGQGQVQPEAPQVPQTQPRPRRAIETMPNVSGRGTSPVKKIPRNIDDLRRLGNELNS